VLVETLPAAFEMDEILYQLRDHMSGLNCSSRPATAAAPTRWAGWPRSSPRARTPRSTRALAKTREDKKREATDGFDGTWVAHPDLVQLAQEEFEKVLRGKPNQLDKLRSEVNVTAEQLADTRISGGTVTEPVSGTTSTWRSST